MRTDSKHRYNIENEKMSTNTLKKLKGLSATEVNALLISDKIKIIYDYDCINTTPMLAEIKQSGKIEDNNYVVEISFAIHDATKNIFIYFDNQNNILNISERHQKGKIIKDNLYYPPSINDILKQVTQYVEKQIRVLDNAEEFGDNEYLIGTNKYTEDDIGHKKSNLEKVHPQRIHESLFLAWKKKQRLAIIRKKKEERELKKAELEKTTPVIKLIGNKYDILEVETVVNELLYKLTVNEDNKKKTFLLPAITHFYADGYGWSKISDESIKLYEGGHIESIEYNDDGSIINITNYAIMKDLKTLYKGESIEDIVDKIKKNNNI